MDTRLKRMVNNLLQLELFPESFDTKSDVSEDAFDDEVELDEETNLVSNV